MTEMELTLDTFGSTTCSKIRTYLLNSGSLSSTKKKSVVVRRHLLSIM